MFTAAPEIRSQKGSCGVRAGGAQREPESFCPALTRTLGRMTQAVNIMFTIEAEVGSPRACRPLAPMACRGTRCVTGLRTRCVTGLRTRCVTGLRARREPYTTSLLASTRGHS